jgi:hypothetical protein
MYNIKCQSVTSGLVKGDLGKNAEGKILPTFRLQYLHEVVRHSHKI